MSSAGAQSSMFAAGLSVLLSLSLASVPSSSLNPVWSSTSPSLSIAPPELLSLPAGAEVTGYRSTHAFTAKRLSTQPAAFLLKNFLSDEECAAILAEAQASGGLHEATTSGETGARRHCEICCLSMQSDVVGSLSREAAGLLLTDEAKSIPGSGCEDLHVLRYSPGGEYKPHYDASSSAPRVLTVLYYLNGVGATWFPFADDYGEYDFGSREDILAHVATLNPEIDGLKVEPCAPGDALAFYNFDESTRGWPAPDMRSLHAGLEVGEEETKWIGSHFFRVPFQNAVAAPKQARNRAGQVSMVLATGPSYPGPGATKHELDEALLHFQGLVATEPETASNQLQLGLVAKRLNMMSVASAALRRANELQPDDGDTKREFCEILVDMGYVEEAEVKLRELVIQQESEEQQQHAFGGPSRARMMLASLLLRDRGQRAEAFSVYREACDAGRLVWAVLAGVAADSMGEHAIARTYYETALADDQYDEDAALHLMLSLLRDGDVDGANKLRATLPDHKTASVDYVLSTPVAFAPSMHYFTCDMLQLALDHASMAPAPQDGLVLEFGVYHGKSIRMIANHFGLSERVDGFDTFEGIPEDWHFTKAGSYSTHGSLPPAPDNVQYHKGLFSDTLPGFLDDNKEKPIRFMNIDCDLYSSTKDIFDAVADRVVPGTVIIFDEYVMNPHWREDEFRAFGEAVEKHGWRYRYVGISVISQQAVVQIV